MKSHSEKSMTGFDVLLNTIARLRGPNGCPWDQEQTHASLKPHLIEECYEVIEALDQEDDEKLCEELGDLLLQIVLHAQIGNEIGSFDISDVIDTINTKLIRRHPHVFGNQHAGDANDVADKWEQHKREEREGALILDGLPISMPALAYSQAMQRRAARVGFDWNNEEDIMDKLVEEVKEFEKAGNEEEKKQEFGDILFTLANIARRQGIDSEEALRASNRKFLHRFNYMEELCHRRSIVLSQLPLEKQDVLWEEAKEALGTSNDLSDSHDTQTP